MYMKGAQPQFEKRTSQLQGKEVSVVSMFADLRDFSSWLIKTRVEEVADLIKGQYEQMIQVCCDCHVDFLKPLGDGFLMLWEADETVDMKTCLKRALDAAYNIHNKYAHYKQELPCNKPAGYGIGISQGLAVRIQPETMLTEMNEIDFLGYPLNCSARMQTLSLKAFQTTVCSSVSALLQSNPEDFLYPDIPRFARILKVPSPESAKAAQNLKGLKSEDCNDFRHLEWVAARKYWL